MRKRRNQILLLAAVLLAGGCIWTAVANREPRYGGHSLSYWLEIYEISDTSDPDTPKELEAVKQRSTAIQAVRHIGTNALPVLVNWISHEPSPLTTALWKLEQGQFRRWFPNWTLIHPAAYRSFLAGFAFDLLEAEAAPAIPALARLANDPRKTFAGYRATIALIAIGPDAFPQLVSVLTNAAARGRAVAAGGIERFATNALPALPALIQCLGDEDVDVARSAAATVSILAARHEEVPPILTNAVNDPSPAVRSAVVGVLSDLAPRPEGGFAVLTNALQDPSPAVRVSAIYALSSLAPRPEGVLPLVTNALKDPDPDVRLDTVKALRAFGEAAVPALRRVLQDHSACFSWTRDVLCEIAPAEATNAIVLAAAIEAFRSSDCHLRVNGIRALLPFGSRAITHAPDLVNALRDSTPEVREEATNALLEIAPELLTNAPPR